MRPPRSIDRLGALPYARLAQLDRALGYEPRGREFESLTAYQWGAPSPQQMTAKMDTGMGPLGSEQGGLVVVVEVAHNDNLTNFKKFVIIYIQAKELSDIVPRTKGSYSKLRLEE